MVWLILMFVAGLVAGAVLGYRCGVDDGRDEMDDYYRAKVESVRQRIKRSSRREAK